MLFAIVTCVGTRSLPFQRPTHLYTPIYHLLIHMSASSNLLPLVAHLASGGALLGTLYANCQGHLATVASAMAHDGRWNQR